MSIENPLDVDVFIDTAPAKEESTNHEIRVRPENKGKAQEDIDEAQAERSKWFDSVLDTRVSKKISAVTSSREAQDNLGNWIYGLSAVKMAFETAKGKTWSGKKLGSFDRLLYSIQSMACAGLISTKIIDKIADTHYSKSALYAQLGSIGLGLLTTPFVKEKLLKEHDIMKARTLEGLDNIKEKLANEGIEFWNALQAVVNQYDFSRIDNETFRSNLTYELQTPEING